MSRLNWKFKIVFFLLPFLLYMAECDFSCKTLTTPDPIDPNPPEVKYYTYEILYERPLGSLIDESSDPLDVCLEIHEKGGGLRGPYYIFTKLSDYAFIATSREIAAESLVKIWTLDKGRWKERTGETGLIWGNPHTVGDIFTLKCVQTGFQKKLLKIEDYRMSNMPVGYEAYRASCKIQLDGTITDE